LLIVHALLSVALIVTVIGQSGKSAGLGAIAGGAEQVFGKKKGLDELLARLTTILAILFVFTSLGLGIVLGR
jgi:preprotein translocase subunit SecG